MASPAPLSGDSRCPGTLPGASPNACTGSMDSTITTASSNATFYDSQVLQCAVHTVAIQTTCICIHAGLLSTRIHGMVFSACGGVAATHLPLGRPRACHAGAVFPSWPCLHLPFLPAAGKALCHARQIKGCQRLSGIPFENISSPRFPLYGPHLMPRGRNGQNPSAGAPARGFPKHAI